MKKKIIIIVLIIIALLIIGGIVGYTYLKNRNEREMANLQINDVNLETIENGTYTGTCSVFPISVEVEVTVYNHVITQIVIVKHDNGQGETAETIIDEVLEAQSLDVDYISGATSSSKVILKAIENALSPHE